MNIRTAIAAVLAATACLTLASCSDNADTNAASKPSSTPTVDPGNAFVTSVIDAHLDSYADGVPAAAELKAFPPKWCDALEAGHTVQWMLDNVDTYPSGETWGTGKTDAYQLVLLGTQAYCPKWTDQVRDDLRESGEY
ncbi:hypothetical protein ACFWJU_06145 [Streptomyces mutabilis]|uniref:hypothetical protein n=1 Tax=Streptomyces mutabilis TaxID=67332 RepID=UPI0036646156